MYVNYGLSGRCAPILLIHLISFASSDQLLFERSLVYLSDRRFRDDCALLARLVGELAVAATHELFVVAVRDDRTVGDGVTLFPIGSSADAHLARDDALDLSVLACFDVVEKARVLPLLDWVSFL